MKTKVSQDSEKNYRSGSVEEGVGDHWSQLPGDEISQGGCCKGIFEWNFKHKVVKEGLGEDREPLGDEDSR